VPTVPVPLPEFARFLAQRCLPGIYIINNNNKMRDLLRKNAWQQSWHCSTFLAKKTIPAEGFAWPHVLGRKIQIK
jgi:hypothetical protein